MSVPNPFPLNIGTKEDSWAKLQLLANVAEQFKVDAAEFNKMVQALEYLYTLGGGTFQSLPPLQLPYYANVAAMYANQANQTSGFLQKVLDGPGDLLVTYYLYNGGTTASAADYDQLTEDQAQIFESSSNFYTKQVQAKLADYEGDFVPPLANGKIIVKEADGYITAIIFDEPYSKYLVKAVALKTAGEAVFLNLANTTQEKHIVAQVTSFNVYEGTNRIEARLAVTGNFAVTTADINPNDSNQNDTLHLFLPLIGGGSGSGSPGADGASAYEIYVANTADDPVLTESEWLSSLQGADGADGQDGLNGTNGTDGSDGADGDSAYQVAVNNGFTGTEAEWIASLQREDVRPRTPIVATDVSGTYNIDFALSIEWKITCTGATTITFSNYDKALGETTGVYITGAVPVLPATVNVVPGSEDFDASLRNYMVLNVFDATASSEVVDMMNKLMTE